METTIKKLEQKVAEIERRNKRVEDDKSWETSMVRRLLIVGLTYIFAILYLTIADTTNPLLGAVVPCAGFLLSTPTLKIVKKWWLKRK